MSTQGSAGDGPAVVNRLPLSADQERLWFLNQVDPADPTFHLSHTARLIGPLDEPALARALAEIVARHEALRARFPAVDGKPAQVIDPPGGFELARLTCEGSADSLVAELATRPFDLAGDRLIRATLIRTGPEEHVLTVVVHHIISDGRSIGILLSELSALYSAFCKGEPGPLPPLRARWSDFVRAETDDAEALAYWKDQLADAPPLRLLTDHPRPAVATPDSALFRHKLRGPLVARFAAAAAAARCTPFMGLMAAYQTLLAARSGQHDFCVGYPTAGRDGKDDDELIGYFASMAVLRADLSGDPTFRELMHRNRARLLAARRHRELPLERLLTALDIERDLSRPPLFQTSFSMTYDASDQAIRLTGLQTDWIETGFSHSPYELKLDIFEHGGEWLMMLVYNRALFDADTIERFARDFESLLSQVADDPLVRLSRLTAPSGEERDRLIHDWNRVAPPARTLFPDLFQEQVALRPEATAVSCGPVRLSYAELDRRADELAARLEVRPGEHVAVCLPRSVESLVALLAVQRTGAAYVPLDPGYPAARLDFVLGDCGASLVLASRESAAVLPAHTVRTVLVDEPEHGQDHRRVRVRGQDTAYVLYTSGSTGRPKGVAVPHAALGNLLAGMADLIGPTPQDVWLALTSLSFDISALELYLPLATGGRVEIADADTALDGYRQIRLIQEAGVTHVQATPSGWRMLLDCGISDPALTALVGGEALGGELAGRMRAAVGRLFNVYGPTETTIWSTAWPVPDPPGEVRIGGPIRGTQVYVVGDHLDLVRQGVPGELVIGGAGVAHGYLGRPALTAERFVPDPYGRPGGRLYRTGDQVRWRADQSLEFIGRGDNQVKLRGHRIELGEVEAACEAVPGVSAAVATVHEENLVVYLVGDVDPDRVRADLADRLPAFLVPAWFIRLPALPLTPNGKLDRRALPTPQAPETKFIAPEGDAEELVADIWCELLGLERVSAADDFFRLGGHSLLAVRVSARLRATAGVELPILTMFTHRTVAELATELEERLLSELAELSDEEAESLLDQP
ncbi:non-ribosomal peptide synthetase [Acrocarpospora catenulata]|uniref:non-ribosomal peptide synthetase n=1 Tax=Acrocarpospora catenulata TaxID=2836182 RepID=UPI001BDA730B|nr:non-ribosomal peptide synthetase [Acrocarpospora catenulata]